MFYQRMLVGIATTATVFCASAALQAQHNGPPAGRFRVHTATEGAPLELVPATEYVGPSLVEFAIEGNFRLVSGNGLTEHLVGTFPNDGNPNEIESVGVNYRIPVTGVLAEESTSAVGWDWGVSLEGVKFDPFAGEFWQGNPRSGWNYDALGGAIALGLDANHAHVQPTGHYHYHGLPFGLLKMVSYSEGRHSPLIGYAADGFPVYALTGVVNGKVTQMKASYLLRDGVRPGGDEPTGDYDGSFVQDYVFVESAGNLDACNGAFTTSAEYPDGTYAYFLTNNWPMAPRCFSGTPDASFKKGPR